MARVLLRTTRVSTRGEGGTAEKVYPTPAAIALRGSEPPVARSVGSSNYSDPDATRCNQCGYPIENRHAISNCPMCDSDNFEGSIT